MYLICVLCSASESIPDGLCALERVDPSQQGFLAGWTMPFAPILEKIQDDIVPNERILEFGPGRNPIFNTIKFSGVYRGIESNAVAFEAIKLAAAQLSSPSVSIHLRHDTMQEFLQKIRDSYTKIIALHVLHFFDPIDFYNAIQGIYNGLQEGGKAYIAMNSSQQMASSIHEKRRNDDLWPGFMMDGTTRNLHMHQTHDTMTELMGDFGFRMTHTEDYRQLAISKDRCVHQPSYFVSSLYVAEKLAPSVVNTQKLQDYYKQAQHKRALSWRMSGVTIPISVRKWGEIGLPNP